MSDNVTVSMIHPQIWTNDLEVYEITDPIPVEEWLEKVTRPGDRLVKLAGDTLISEGRYAGGQVVGAYLGGEDDLLLFAIPAEAIPLLEGLLADEDYRKLVNHTPSLAGMVK